jgi:hypothetical protein
MFRTFQLLVSFLMPQARFSKLWVHYMSLSAHSTPQVGFQETPSRTNCNLSWNPTMAWRCFNLLG